MNAARHAFGRDGSINFVDESCFEGRIGVNRIHFLFLQPPPPPLLVFIPGRRIWAQMYLCVHYSLAITVGPILWVQGARMKTNMTDVAVSPI